MLRKFKVELEICGPAHSTIEDITGFMESLKANKDIVEDMDIFAFGSYEILDEGAISVDEWNGDEIAVIAIGE